MSAPSALNLLWNKDSDVFEESALLCHEMLYLFWYISGTGRARDFMFLPKFSKNYTDSSLGYRTVVANNNWENIVQHEKKKKKESSQKVAPVESPDKMLKNKEKLGKLGVKALSRFTMIMRVSGDANILSKNDDVRCYDIHAVQPTNEKMFHIACKELHKDVDIITFDMSEKLPFHFKRAALGVAIEHGVHFEICYAPMLRDSTSRRNIIAAGQALVDMTKGRNIILSSGSEHKMDVRGPYDVMNLAALFGLTQEQAKAVVTTNCMKVIKHAESRRTCVGVIRILPTAESKSKWLLEQDQETDNESDAHEDDERPRKKLKS